MKITKRIITLNIFLVLVLLCSVLLLGNSGAALAAPGKMSWSIVDTPAPGQPNNLIVSPSEINSIVVGNDGTTLYAVDVADNRTYKSTDGGITWPAAQELSGRLTSAPANANLPIWNIAVAPDDVNFVVAITDGAAAPGPPNGPKEIFISRNGGSTWEQVMSNLTIAGGEYISCVDISMIYGAGSRDIAIGTRDGAGTGRVWTFKTQSWGAGWIDQGFSGDVLTLKFSPTYTGDSSLVVISANAAGTFLNLGFRDVVTNTTTWKNADGYPVPIIHAAFPGTSPTDAQIITADLELPIDFSGSDPGGLRRYYVNTDVNLVAVQAGVYRIDNNQVYRISPNVSSRFSSIAYLGTYAEGKLLVGEVNNPTPATLALVNIWRCSDPINNSPTWSKSDEYKSPTGGAGSGDANAQVAWSHDGLRAYCGTSSASLSAGGAGGGAGQWPLALLTHVSLDESAFSISPYSAVYERLLNNATKTPDQDVGDIWNQTSLIDTEITQLCDVAALEVSADSDDYNILYLSSDNATTQPFNSVWRSTGDLPGLTWERILCTMIGSTDDTILRVNPRVSEGGVRSNVLVFAELNTSNIMYSPDEGHSWQVLHPSIDTSILDLTLASDDLLYILDGSSVRRAKKSGILWTWKDGVETELSTGHTITTPLENPKKVLPAGTGEETYEDWVIVGDIDGKMAYADFTQLVPEFEPLSEERSAVTTTGNMHVIADDTFQKNKMIYAATDGGGAIYRWTAGTSTAWDELRPINSDFYGIEERNDVLYGLWDTPTTPPGQPGADRTLESRMIVPPYPEWDDLTAGLPQAGANFPVEFTREPTALKLSENDYNTLWAIDNRPYDWTNKIGCLWAYVDTFAKVGPWSYAPASGDIIPVDPVTGRASQVDFQWHELTYALGYELQVAKDEEFTIQILASDNITPVDQLAPAVFFPAGGLSPTPASAVANWGNLEASHVYYWRVRASRATSGEVAHSPWSASMYFTVETGLPVEAKHIGLTLLKPKNGAKNVSQDPAFSWSPAPRTAKYEFILSKNATLSDVVVKSQTKTTAYQYDGKLDSGTTYYWQVRAIEPVPGDPSPVANFRVEEIKQPEEKPPEEKHIPKWVWPVVIVWSILIIAMIVFANTKPGFIKPKAKSIDLGPPERKTGNPIASLIAKIRQMRHRDTHKDDEL